MAECFIKSAASAGGGLETVTGTLTAPGAGMQLVCSFLNKNQQAEKKTVYQNTETVEAALHSFLYLNTGKSGTGLTRITYQIYEITGPFEVIGIKGGA